MILTGTTPKPSQPAEVFSLKPLLEPGLSAQLSNTTRFTNIISTTHRMSTSECNNPKLHTGKAPALQVWPPHHGQQRAVIPIFPTATEAMHSAEWRGSKLSLALPIFSSTALDSGPSLMIILRPVGIRARRMRWTSNRAAQFITMAWRREVVLIWCITMGMRWLRRIIILVDGAATLRHFCGIRERQEGENML